MLLRSAFCWAEFLYIFVFGILLVLHTSTKMGWDGYSYVESYCLYWQLLPSVGVAFREALFFLGGAFILRVLLWLKMQKLFYGIGSTSTLFYCICLRNRIILTQSSYCGNYRNNITSKKHINDTDNIKRTQRKYGYHIGFSRQRRRCCNMPKW